MICEHLDCINQNAKDKERVIFAWLSEHLIEPSTSGHQPTTHDYDRCMVYRTQMLSTNIWNNLIMETHDLKYLCSCKINNESFI